MSRMGPLNPMKVLLMFSKTNKCRITIKSIGNFPHIMA